ncbi:Small ribosomal subunit biogenesis [Friedmanniomyces endolithicus]|uniref:Small ribosomal subunit biogenesis n=1 Tax=Friedmanniomyces endolithicus TaxID=329885 RepID=A0AAN6KQY0_9PEZI|nr:Small ribosomal subunit biogenesis [Friedmanniomyces endolithicus]KAK0783908.1 Small ribosomal subunit biogenesis [Friedmanniomyces endolithicus]KAK0790264.1 Small ribosomal subunit biogenesis [Friedmanniomyces endolithicus]KAK0821227.1 Small ribosomal subunit biogenesis [Friedmanniomyces endolithicus]KAK0838848.1 Small ribosomal subunit biogenesis [Friedmanniomyces endolithicus]
MKLSNQSTVPVYTIAGASTARPLPEWLARKRRRSLKRDPEFANRIELLQDFEFEEASACVRVSENGEWAMSTGTYKPQIHTHYLPHLSLSFARHTDTLNQTFILLSSDYTKSLHLQTDRSLEFHTAGGLHYRTRLPRYGRDLKFNKRTAEALVPVVGVNADGSGEVYRLNLELGRYMKAYEVNVGGDDFESLGGGALQGGIRTGAVNCAAIAEESHGLMAFGTSLSTVELWDSRSRNRVSVIGQPSSSLASDVDATPQITALEFHRSGLNFATGSSTGVVHTYDLRLPVPLLRKEHGYDYPIQTLKYLTPSSRSSSSNGSENLIMSADKRAIKLWNSEKGDHWTMIEPAVDLNCVEWLPDSGMLLTANEGRQQHAFFIPQLGPAPRWCAFLDNLVEEMAEDTEDPHAFNTTQQGAGEVYDNYKFLDMKQLREFSLDHLIGQTNLLRPYMHGYFVAQKLYEQARLLANPDMAEQARQKSIQQRITKERESRIRGNKKVTVKVNRRYAEKLAAREEANERRKAERVLRQGGDEPHEVNVADAEMANEEAEVVPKKKTERLLDDARFKSMFEEEDFAIDEQSREFVMHNPSTNAEAAPRKRGLTAVEGDELDERKGSSGEDDDDSADEDAAADAAALRARQQGKRRDNDAEDPRKRIGSTSYKKGAGGKTSQSRPTQDPQMRVSSSNTAFKKQKDRQSKSFGDLASDLPAKQRASDARANWGNSVGEKEVTFAPSKPPKQRPQQEINADAGRDRARGKDRRSASGNVFRRM